MKQALNSPGGGDQGRAHGLHPAADAPSASTHLQALLAHGDARHSPRRRVLERAERKVAGED
jgi:hypothetical protein